MKIELLFKNIPELLTAYAKFEKTVKVVQILIAYRSRTLIEPSHCVCIRFFSQFGYLLFVQLAQHHVLLHLRQLMNREKQRILIAITEKSRLKNQIQ